MPQTSVKPIDALFARVSGLGGPFSLSRPRQPETTMVDLVEAVGTLLVWAEGWLSKHDGMIDASSRASTAMSVRTESPHPDYEFDLTANRPWLLLAALVASLQGVEARFATLMPSFVAPPPLAALDPADVGSFRTVLDDLVTRAMAIDQLIRTRPAA